MYRVRFRAAIRARMTKGTSSMANTDKETAAVLAQAENHLLDALRNLRFGAIEMQVHDFRIVRITRTEKLRIGTDQGASNS
jgi:hypothetical protein